ncbi:hypothetical protein KGM_202122 [Danaus plexippus plexippus]|uniref:Kazal-like domain-containing protein n=1 Tax=Danaus plexippus plexippus TaxID=278856 RepID=A0A212ETK1_DANPL|nr:hypothetical protein KGM_202122 [Danaus plexippus plexippus]
MLLLLGLLTFALQAEAIDWGCYSNVPVCGIDGVTYKNICQFKEAKLLDPDLQVLYEGPCVKLKMLPSYNLMYDDTLVERQKPMLDKKMTFFSKKYINYI